MKITPTIAKLQSYRHRALAVGLVVLPAAFGLAANAQGTSTAGTAASVDYSSLFDGANITANLVKMGGFVLGTAVAFGSIPYARMWVGRFLGKR